VVCCLLWLNSFVKIKVAWIGKTKEPAIQSLTNEYVKRLRHYAEVEAISLKDEATLFRMAGAKARPQERHVLVLLDGRGRQLSSEELAGFLRGHRSRNPQPLLFAVGPADGFSEDACAEAAFVLSLGRMTLAHELARIVLLEQLYRAFTILNGHPYHTGH